MTLEGALKYPLSFIIALGLAYLLTPICIRLAHQLGIVDTPGWRRLHDKAVPRAGGIALFLALHVTAACLFLYPWQIPFLSAGAPQSWLALLAASTVLLAVGLLDDKFGISWSVKLLGQTGAALMMFSQGVKVYAIQGNPLPTWLSLTLTVFWFLAFINAFNLIDGLDGLASGLGIIAALGLAASTLYRELPFESLMLLALAGSCLGFLRYNFHPAKIFLGDSGSMLLGFTLAAIGLEGTSKSTTIAAIGVPFLAIGIPLFDTMLAIWRRSVKAVSNKDKVVGKVVSADMEHLHHRLLKAGFTQRKVALTLYAVNAVFVSFAILTVVFNSRAVGIFLLATLVASYIIVKHLAQIELWDSGSAIISGIKRPRGRTLPFLIYPLIDAALLTVSLALVVFLVFQPDSVSNFRSHFTMRLPVWCGVPFIILGFSGVYNRVWSRARPSEFGLLGLTLIASFALCVAVRMIMDPSRIWGTLLIGIAHGGLSVSMILGIRTLPRLVQDFMVQAIDPREKDVPGGVLVYGAGTRGILYLRRRSYKTTGKAGGPPRILGFIDDEPGLRKRKVHGYYVHGTLEELSQIVEDTHPTQIIITCEPGEQRMNKLISYCRHHDIRLAEWLIYENELLGGEAGGRGSLAV